MRRTSLAALGLLVLPLGSCAAPEGVSTCMYYTTFSAGPLSATADHSVAAPGNQQQFQAAEGTGGTGSDCKIPQVMRLVQPNWTSSAPLDVSVSSAKDSTNGLAACTGSTSGPVTLTATSTEDTTPKTVSVQLTCK